MLEENVSKIKESISQACQQADRNPESVKIIAVTKSVTSEIATPLLDLGITDFAENRVDKMLEKQEELKSHENITWHLIGTLQRRKVKNIIDKVDYFHALDSISLASEIQKRATKQIKCFVQVNVSGEESKQGVSNEQAISFIKELEAYDKIQIIGLMTMAPLEATDGFIESCFKKLKLLQQEIAELNLIHAPCQELSMGMSQDYPLAIRAGTTCVRIGTAFFKD